MVKEYEEDLEIIISLIKSELEKAEDVVGSDDRVSMAEIHYARRLRKEYEMLINVLDILS